LLGDGVKKNVGGLYVFVDQTSLVHLGDGCSDADSEAQEPLNLHWRVQKLTKQLPSGVFEYQSYLAIFMYELERVKCPGAIEIFREFAFANKSFETVGRCALRDGEQGDRCAWVSILAPDPAQKDVASLRRQDLDYVAIFDLANT
jgi:hypothetical protein